MKTTGLALLVIVFATRMFAGVEEACDAMNRGDYDKAMKEFTVLADKGDTKAMTTIGMLYYHGEGVVQDYKKAFEWYLKAMDKGNADAFNNLGVMFRDAQGVPKDLSLAYALISTALMNAGNEDALARAKRNIEKIDMLIAKEDYEKATKLVKAGLTAKMLRKRCSDTANADGKSIAEINTTNLWAIIKASYDLNDKSVIAYRNVRISKVYKDEYNEFAGGLGFSPEPMKDFSSFVTNNIFTSKEGRFSIVVPRLSVDMVEVHISKVGKTSTQVKFFEDGCNSLAPWDGKNTAGQAVVITQVLPDEWKGTAEQALSRLESMQKEFLREISPGMYRLSVVDGKLGKAVQAIVLNRRGSAIYPQTAAKLFPPRDGITTVGINRVMYVDKVIVELGLIIPKPKSVATEDLANYAVDQMNIFMSGFNLLPRMADNKGR